MTSDKPPLRFREPEPDDYAKSSKNPDKPPVFREADFAMRFAQGRWSEDRLIDGINQTAAFRAIPYGRSQVGPDDQEGIAKYWREYCAAESHGKRPDLLVLHSADYDWALGQLGADPTVASEEAFDPVVAKAVCGVEAENSLWVGSMMKDFAMRIPLTTKDPKSPNIWVKDQDVPGLRVWMHHYQKPVVVVQVFYDLAIAMELTELLGITEKVQAASPDERDAVSKRLGLFIRQQKYADSRGGFTTKTAFVAHHSIATLFGNVTGGVSAEAKVVTGKNGRIMPYVAFSGGGLTLTEAGIDLFTRVAAGGGG